MNNRDKTFTKGRRTSTMSDDEAIEVANRARLLISIQANSKLRPKPSLPRLKFQDSKDDEQ